MLLLAVVGAMGLVGLRAGSEQAVRHAEIQTACTATFLSRDETGIAPQAPRWSILK